MSGAVNWWRSDPVVDQPAAPSWEADPMVQPPQQATPQGRLDRFLTGAGDVPQGAMQLSVNATGGANADNWAMRMLRGNPNLAPLTRDPVTQSLTPDAVNASVAQREATYQEGRRMAGASPDDTDWWRVGGQVAATLPAAVASPAGSTTLRAGAAGVAQGAALGAAQPVTDPNAEYWPQVGQNAALGAVTGGIGGAAGYGVGRLISGAQNVNPAVRELSDRGVAMTPGQIVGGYTRRIEDSAGSIPILGAQIRGGQRASIESFNRATANEVLSPLGQIVDSVAPVGRDLLDDVYTRIGQAYDTALPRVQPFGPDQQFMADLSAASQRFLTPDSARQFNGFLRNNIMSRAGGGRIDGDTFKAIEEELGRAFRTYRASGAPADREFASAALDVQRAFRDLLERANPAVAPQIQAANQAFARFTRMEGAAAAQGATEGVFTPAQLSGAVRRGDSTARHGGFARGDALMQDLSDAGRAVLPSTVPDSGTPERMMLAALLGGGAGMGASTAGLGLAPSLAAGAIGAGAYSGPGQRAIQALLLGQRPAGVAAAGNALATTGGPLGVALGNMLLDPPPPPNRFNQRR